MSLTRKFLSTSLLLLAAHALLAQTTTSSTGTSTTDPELQKLQTQQAIMDAKVGILQDQQKATIGMLPSSSVTPKQGSVTMTGDQPIQGRVIAYTAAGLLAKEIARIVCGAVPTPGAGVPASTPLAEEDNRKKVVIYDSAEIASIVNYQAFVQQLNYINRQFNDNVKDTADKTITRAENETKRLAPPPRGQAQAEALPAVLIPGLVEGGLKSVIDIIGLFRTDTSISGKDFIPDDAALVAATAAELRVQGCVVYEPAVEPVAIFDPNSQLLSSLLSLREGVLGLQLRLAIAKTTLQQQSDSLAAILQAQTALDALNKNIVTENDAKKKKALEAQKKPAEDAVQQAIQAWLALTGSAAKITASDALALKALKDKALKNLDPVSTALSNISTALDGLQTVLFKADDSGQAVMSKLLRAEKLYNAMTRPGAAGKPRVANAYVLTEKMAALTGGVVTKQNFWVPTRTFYNGGSIATYTLFAPSGEVLRSGTLTKRSNNVKAVNEDGNAGAPSQFYPCDANTGELCKPE